MLRARIGRLLLDPAIRRGGFDTTAAAGDDLLADRLIRARYLAEQRRRVACWRASSPRWRCDDGRSSAL